MGMAVDIPGGAHGDGERHHHHTHAIGSRHPGAHHVLTVEGLSVSFDRYEAVRPGSARTGGLARFRSCSGAGRGERGREGGSRRSAADGSRAAGGVVGPGTASSAGGRPGRARGHAGRWERVSGEVLHGLTLSVHEGEIVAVVGASGSGKTVLADALLGLYEPNATVRGTIWFDGVRQDAASLASLRGSGICLVPQSVSHLDPLMRVGEQVQGAPRGRTRAERARDRARREARQRELFELYGLAPEVARMYPHELSGGMARRVLLMSALMEEPRVLIADEPTPGLDLALAIRAVDDLRTFANTGAGVILITHDLELAVRVADRVAVFKEGRIVEETSASSFADPALLEHPFSRDLCRALLALQEAQRRREVGSSVAGDESLQGAGGFDAPVSDDASEGAVGFLREGMPGGLAAPLHRSTLAAPVACPTDDAPLSSVGALSDDAPVSCPAPVGDDAPLRCALPEGAEVSPGPVGCRSAAWEDAARATDAPRALDVPQVVDASRAVPSPRSVSATHTAPSPLTANTTHTVTSLRAAGASRTADVPHAGNALHVPVLEARGLSCAFGSDRVLFRDLDLSVHAGERVAIVAPSGAGKTTLCRILAGYRKPDAGCVLVRDVPLGGAAPGPHSVPPEDAAPGPRSVQLISQHPEKAFDPRMHMRDSLAEAGDLTDARSVDLRARFGVRDAWLDRLPHELSGGELMRFCLVRALMTGPTVLICDESTAMLDLVTQDELWSQIRELQESWGFGLILVSHSPGVIAQVATRLLYL